MIKPFIETKINHHRTLAEKLLAETKDMVEAPRYTAELLKRFSPQEAARGMQEAIDSKIARFNALDILAVSEIKSQLKSERRATLPEVVRTHSFAASTHSMPDDYQARISNALVYLRTAGSALTDSEAFTVLKPFFSDWGQMRLFENVIIHSIPECNGSSYEARKMFPRSLGAILDIADTHERLFNEAEELAEEIFTEKGNYLNTTYVDGFAVQGSYIADGYDQRAAQDRLIEVAEEIDSISTGGGFIAGAGSKGANRDNDNDFIWM